MSVLVPVALVTLSSSSSGSVSTVSAIHVEMSGGLGAGGAVHSGSSGEVVEGLITHGVESSSYHTTCRNPSELVEGISHSRECHRLANLEPSVCVVLPP